MEWLARIRSPAARIQRAAGPPETQSVAALVIGVIAAVVLTWTVPREIDWRMLLLIPIGLTLVVALADRDGWSIREAMTWVAHQQRRRWHFGRAPATKREATAWLEDARNDRATDLERAVVLSTAGRVADAIAAVDAAGVESDLDRVRKVRLRSAFMAMADPTMRIDLDAIRAAAVSLPVDERQYQVVSAAWSQAWLDVVAGRPWRSRFALIARDCAPYDLPAPLWIAAVAVQQLLLPAVLAAALGFAYLVLRD
jgi:hypothetical protein